MAVKEARFGGMLDQLFKISQRGSSVRTEVIAGITTFLTMGYILFVNPSILGLGGNGLPFEQVLSVTALAAGVMTLAMGLFGNYPFAIAAGLGLNAFVAYALVGGGLTFPQAMGVIVAEGLLITLLVITGIREAIVDAIPMDLKRAIGIGIGAFIALIGLVEAGIVSPEGATPLALGANRYALSCSTELGGVRDRQIEHDAAADRATHHHRLLEFHGLAEGADGGGIALRRQPVFGLFPAIGRRRARRAQTPHDRARCA